MDKFDPIFFSTIAQVSITLIGFSLLLPVVKGLSSDIGAIKGSILIRKNFEIGILPLIIVVVPLLTSLTIIISAFFVMICSPLLRYIIYGIYGIHGIILVAYYYMRTERYIVSLPSNVPSNVGVTFRILKSLAELLLGLYPGLVLIFFLIETFLMGTSLLFFKICSLWLVLVGLLMIIRTLVISPTTGIKYSFTDLDEKWKEEVEKFFSKIDSAISRRKEEIEKLRKILKQPTIKKWRDAIETTIAESEAEIIGMQQKIEEPIRKRCDSLKTNKETNKYFTVNELREIENRRKDGERNIDNFEIGTIRLQRKFQMMEKYTKVRLIIESGDEQN